jgi:hypothetical protein
MGIWRLRRREKYLRGFGGGGEGGGEPEGTSSLGDQGVDERLKWILKKKWGVMKRIHLARDRYH